MLPRGRKLLFATLYFTEGAPIGLLWWYLPTELRVRGLDVDRITAITALLALPWALKFVWAPLLDVCRGPRAGLRPWVAGAQAGMIATLVPLLWLDPVAEVELLWKLLLAHAFCAATQDVAIDAWAIRSSHATERGALNAWMQAGMLLGRVAFSGGALALGAALSFRAIVGALIVVLAAGIVAVALADGRTMDAPDRASQPGERLRAVAAALAASARNRRVQLAALVAVVGGAGFEVVGALAGPFLVDLGRSREAVGGFWTVAALAAIPGGLLAGRAADRVGHARTTRRALLALTGAVAAVTAVAAIGDPGIAPEVTAVLVFLALGAFNAASYALFMDLSATAAGATTFSAFMGLTNLCEAWAARTGGALVGPGGYALAFAVPAAIACVALPALGALARRERTP